MDSKDKHRLPSLVMTKSRLTIPEEGGQIISAYLPNLLLSLAKTSV